MAPVAVMPFHPDGSRLQARQAAIVAGLLGDDLQGELLGPAEDRQPGPDADAFLGQEAVQVVDPGDGVVVEADDDVPLLEAGPSAGPPGSTPMTRTPPSTSRLVLRRPAGAAARRSAPRRRSGSGGPGRP